MSHENIINEAQAKMQKSIEALKNNMAKIRTGRANTSLLDHVMVVSYGSETPLNQVASISVLDARTLSVTPWDKSLVSAVEKAIYTSDLGLNPLPYENAIRVPIPQLTEDRRRDLVKIIKEEAEQSRISIRQIRRDSNQSVKQALKEKTINEDENKRLEQKIQQITDTFIGEIDLLFKQKEQDVMSL